MNPVTVNASGNVMIARLCQRRTMNTVLIGIIDRTVAAGAGLRDLQTCILRKLSGLRVDQACLLMRVMAVRTDRRIQVSSVPRLLMDTIQGFVIFISVAILTGNIKLQRDITDGIGIKIRMRECADILMTINAGDVLLIMNAVVERIGIDKKG